MVSNNCCRSSLIKATNDCPRLHAHVLPLSAPPWLTALLARRPAKVAAIALANKMARMAWAMMAKGQRYKEPVALAV
jgi:transposase